MDELIDFSSIGIWWQDSPGRFGEVLCGARGSWLPVVFPVGRLPSRLHILVTQRTAPEPVSILMLDFCVEPLRADMPWRWFPRLNPAPEPSGILHPNNQASIEGHIDDSERLRGGSFPTGGFRSTGKIQVRPPLENPFHTFVLDRCIFGHLITDCFCFGLLTQMTHLFLKHIYTWVMKRLWLRHSGTVAVAVKRRSIAAQNWIECTIWPSLLWDNTDNIPVDCNWSMGDFLCQFKWIYRRRKLRTAFDPPSLPPPLVSEFFVANFPDRQLPKICWTQIMIKTYDQLWPNMTQWDQIWSNITNYDQIDDQTLWPNCPFTKYTK